MASKDLLPIYHNGQLEYSSYDKAAEARKNGDEVVPLRHFKFEDGTEQFVSYEKSTAFQEQWAQEGRQATELFHAINTDNPSELITQTTEERDAAWKAESGRWGEFGADYGEAVVSQVGRAANQIPKMIVGLSQLTNAGLGWLTSAGGLAPNVVSDKFHLWAKDNARMRQGLDQFEEKHLSKDKQYDHLMSDGVRTTRETIEGVTNLAEQLLIGGGIARGAQAVNAAATAVKGVAPVARVAAPAAVTKGQMVVEAGKQLVTGPGTAYAAGMAGEAAGETHATAIEQGVDPNRAAEIAMKDAFTSYFLNRADVESGAISAVAGPAVSKTVKQWFLGGLLRPFKSDVAKRIMRNVAWEGGSEALDQWMHLSRLQDAGVELSQEDKARATAQAGLYGALGGALGEVGGYLESRSELKNLRRLFAVEHQAEAAEAFKRAAEGQPVATDAPGGPAAVTQNGGVLFKDGAVVHGDGTITTVNGVVTDTDGEPVTIRPEVNQQSTIDLFRLIRESDLKVQNLPVESIAVNDRVKQFKADADAATGVVAGERLQGAYNPIPAKPILVMEFADGHREVVTGRHRLDLAKQNQMAQIPANIIYEKDGWTIESARLMDAYDNILDGKGSDQDFVNFFRNSKLDAQTLAEHPELYGRKRQAEAKLLAENASDDLYTFFMGKDERMTLDVASAIAREAPMGANAYAGDIQRAVMRAVLNDGVRATDAAIMARSLMSAYKQRIEAKGIQQLSLFGDDDSFQLAMTLEAKFASSKVREIETDLRALKQATGKQSGNLKAREALLKKYGLESSEDVEGMQRIIGELEAKKVRWQNYYTDPELAQQAHAYAKQALHLDDIAVEMPDGRMTTVNQEAGAVAAANAAAETDTGDNPDQGGFNFLSETVPDEMDGDFEYSVIMGEQGAAGLQNDIQAVDNLDIAKSMLGKRDWKALSYEEKVKIKFSTGWEMGADGKWRFEWKDFEIGQSWAERDTLEGILAGEGAADLLKAYPQLRKMRVRFEKLPGSVYGGFRPDKNEIVIDADKHRNNTDLLRKTLTHEIQHAIQKIEGFALGARVATEKMNLAAKRYFDAENDPAVSQFELDVYLADYLAAKREAQDAYKRTAGEVEARNAAKRRYQGPTFLLLEDTEDIGRAYQRSQNDIDFAMMPTMPKAALKPSGDTIESRFTVENAPHFSVVSDEGLMTVDIADGATEAEINTGLKGVLAAAREAGVEVKVDSFNKLTNVQREAIIKHNDATPAGIETFYTHPRGEKKSGWMKAPNGERTILDERQWTQVRGGNFKAWFGDWEGVATLRKLREAKQAHVKEQQIDISEKKIQERFRQILARPAFHDTPVGKIVIDKRSARTTLGHNYSQKKIDALVTLQQDFANAVYIGSARDYDGKDLTNHYFAYPIEYGNNREKDIVFCRAREDVNVNRLYVHEVLLLKEIEIGDTSQIAAASSLSDASHTNVSPRGKSLAYMILKKLYENNPKNVSKVVDENGEPLVVYHGTGEDFKIFQHSKIGSNTKNKGIFGNGFYATDQRSLAERYAKYNRPNGKVMSLFVNMRNPFRWSDPASVEIARKLGFPESRIKNGKLLPLVEERQILDFTAKLKNAGYDGTIYTYPEGGSEYCVWDSNQFKSATDNHGGYSDANPNIDMNVAEEMRSTLESTVYPNGGRVPVVGSPAAEKGRVPLALHHVVGIYRELAGRYPKVVKDANRGPRGALGWFRNDTQDIAVRAQLFGLADATDIQALHDDLKQKGFFRNEDPNWCAHHSKRVVIHEKCLSQIKLHEALNKLVDRRIKSGIHQGIGTKVMAHELWHYIDQLDGVKVREHGNFLAHILNLKQSHAEVMPETSFTTDTELINEATNFIAWWIGIKPDQVQYHKQPKEAYAEMGAALWLDPGAVAQRAPKYYRAMMEGMQRHPSAMRAWEKAVAAIEGKTDVSGLMDRLSAQWSREAETERRRLRSRLQRVAPEGANLFERLYYRFFGANNAMKFARIFTDKHAPVVMVANEATSIALRQAEKMVKKGKLTQDEYNALKLAANAAVEDVSYLLTQYRHQYGRSKIFLADLSEKVIQASRKLDVDMQTLAKYLHLKRVIEIGDRATALGIDAPTAHKALNQMSRELGLSKMHNVISMANQFRAVYEQAVINNAQVASMLGPDNMRLLQRNKHYVTMRHVDDAGQIVDMHEQLDQKGKAGRDPLTLALTQMMRIGGGVSTETGYRLHRLTGSFRATSNPVTATAETAVAIIEAAQKNAMIIELADTLERFKFPEFRILEKGENEVNNDRFGTVHFMKNGEVKAMVVPREVADVVMDKSTSIPGITTFCRFINSGRTTNNITFIAPAYERDLAAFAINNKGFKRSPLHWLSAFNLGAAMRLIPGKPGAVLGGVTDAGAYVAMAAQFIPPHVMKSIGKHPLGRFLFNTSTVEYWTSFGHKMARMIQRGEFEQTLQEAKAAREAGNISKAEELEYCAVMARKALEDGVLLTMRQMRNDDFVKSDLKQLFDKYNISFEDDVDTMAPLPERVWKVLKDPKQWGTAAWQSASKSAHGIWEGIGNLSEIEEMTVKLAGYCALHNQATGGKQQFSNKDRKRVALQTAEMVGSPDFAARGLLAQMIEMSTSSFWNARLRAGLRSVKSATQHPGSWFGKAALHALPTLTSLMVTSGLLRRSLVWLLTDDNDEEKLKGTVAGSVIDALRWQEEAMKKVSVYAQRAYRCLPIWFDGLTTICLKLPIPDEAKLIDMGIRAAWNKFAEKCGLGSPDPGVGFDSVVHEAANQFGFDPSDRGSIWSFLTPFVSPYLFGSNPHESFRDAPMYSERDFKARFLEPANFAEKVTQRTWNASPFAQLYRFRESDGGPHSDSTKELRWILNFPVVGPTLARFCSVDSGGELQTLREYEKIDEAQRAADRIKVEQLFLKMEAQEELSAEDTLFLLQNTDRLKQLFKEAKKPSALRKLESIKSIKNPDTRLRAIDAINAN